MGREKVADLAASSPDVRSRRMIRLPASSNTKIESDDNEDSHASALAVVSKNARVSAASSVNAMAISAPPIVVSGAGATVSVSLSQDASAAAKAATTKRIFFMMIEFFNTAMHHASLSGANV